MRRISRATQVLVMLLAGVVLIVLILVLARPDDAPGLTAQILPSPKQDGGFPYPLPEITGKLATAQPKESAYPPPASTSTGPTPIVTPWPTPTPFPTKEPPPPAPTLQPTPVVTPIPVAEPPYIPGLEDVTPQPFHIVIREGNRVSIMNDDGTDERLLIDTEEKAGLYLGHYPLQGIEGPPLRWGSVSPDGATLALVVTDLWKVEYKGQRYTWQIHLYDTRTDELRFLVEGREPVWSPDGSRIAYVGMDAGLWIVDIGSDQTQKVFSAKEEYWVRDAIWSPDGQRIAFVHELASMGTGYSDVLLVEASGSSAVIQLLPASEFGGWSVAIVGWSQAGRGIFYRSGIGEHDGPEPANNLWFLDIETGQQSQLTRNILVLGQQQSPDGAWMVLSGPRLYESESWLYRLWLVHLDSGALYRLTNGPVDDLDPRWSPDGTRLVFSREGQSLWTFSLIDGMFQLVFQSTTDFAVVR